MNKDLILHTVVQRLVRHVQTLSPSRANSQSVPYVLRTTLLLLMMVVGVNTIWGQTTTYTYYALHKDGKGYLKQSKGVVYNDGSFRYANSHDDNGSSIWVLSSDGYLQQEMYYLNVANDRTLYLSTTPVTQWDLVDDSGKTRFQPSGSTKVLGLDSNNNPVLDASPANKYTACTLTVTESNWNSTLQGSALYVQSPQMVTYLRYYYKRNITVLIDKNDKGDTNQKVVDNKESRCYCSLAYKSTSNTDKGTKWDINTTTGVVYNMTTSQVKNVAATYEVAPLDPIVLSNHAATDQPITLHINAKALSLNGSKKYLLFNTEDDNYRFPKASTSLTEGNLLPVNGKQSDLTEAVNGEISWDIEVDGEDYYSFKNVTTGRYIYYDANDYSVSDYGAVKIGDTSIPDGDTRYKFRLLGGGSADAFKRGPFDKCLYIIPYNKQFAVYKSDGVLAELYFALYMNTSGSTKFASIYKASDDAKWKIYTYEWEYHLWDDYSINGDQSLYATGSKTYTASTWFSRNIKGSPNSGEYCMLPDSKTHDGITYTWELTGLTGYIDTNDALSSGTSTLTATINSLPPSTRSGSLKVTAKITSPANLSNNKTIPISLYNLNPTLVDIDELSDITDENGLYRLTADNTYSSSNKPSVTTFSGTLTAKAKDDGTFPVISGLTEPLFTTANNASISNITFKSITVSGSDNVGAICGIANGTTRIYNCGILPTSVLRQDEKDNKKITGFSGSSVGGSGNVGGLVGKLEGNARVINCYSYATITGGSIVAGIVGNIGYAGNTSITQDDVDSKPMVVNCMFYGDITGGSLISPVYGGADGAMIKNDAEKGVNPYCYYRGNAAFDDSYNDIKYYKRSWPAEEEYLTRFEYYRSILNSNRQLCTYWVTGKKVTNQTSADTMLIAKWVLDPSIAPYPVLKKWGYYPSVINPDPNKTWDPDAKNGDGDWQSRSSAESYRGKSFTPKLNVTVNPGNKAPSGIDPKDISLTITDMDTPNHDYGYYKVQLPYYNDIFGDPTADPTTQWDKRYGGNYKANVVTGWKITSISGGVTGVTNSTGTDANGVAFDHTFTADWESGYNFADRYCTTKDIYSSTNPRVFAQGGFFYVPEGVTDITIEAYWGKAVYLHNSGHYIDRVNITNKSGNRTVGDPFTSAGTLPTTFQGQTVWDAWHTAVTKLDVAGTGENPTLSLTVYDQAIVLLSNYQLRNENGAVGTNINSNKWYPYTIMSIDQDMDNEPDYCFEFQFRSGWNRDGIQPIRFDFLPVPELGMAVRHNTQQNTIGIFIPQGHFEITETSFMHLTQFEYDGDKDNKTITKKKIPAPIILNGGHFDQLVVRYTPFNNIQYFLMGGHFRMLRFAPGAHANKNNNPLIRLCAVNAIGGEYPEFYLSGIYRPDITPTDVTKQGNPHCYTNGGYFGIMAGGGYDKILGNITFKIDHSLIDEFYGGGINGSKPVGGNIDVTIDHSLVTKYCGGPKVGLMDNQTVSTYATGTTFTKYFGGGNGGTSFYRDGVRDGNDWSMPAQTAAGWKDFGYGTFNPLNTISGVNPSYEGTGDKKGYHAQFEFECFVESNGLGANPTLRSYRHWAQFGSTSTGNTTSILDNCTIEEDFYGGGNLGNVNGWVKSTLANCTVKGNAFGGGYSGKIEPFRIHDKNATKYPYIDNAGVMQRGNGEFDYVKNTDDSDRYYTWCYKNASGKIFPEGVVIPSDASTNTNLKSTFEYPTGSNKWYVLTTVSLEGLGAVSEYTSLTLKGNTVVGTEGDATTGNVYGGGNESAVDGNTTVIIQGNTEVLGNVFGGGNNAIVGGSSTVKIEKEQEQSGN